jgi:hypothetical protein
MTEHKFDLFSNARTMVYNKKKMYELKMECLNRRLSAAGNIFGLVQRLVDDDKQNHQRNVQTLVEAMA